MVRIPAFMLTLGVLIATAVVPSGARAGDKEDKVIAHVKAAQEASANGDYATAIKEYESGFKLMPNPNLLIAIALEHRAAGQSEKALEHLRRFLKETPADHKRRAEAESLLKKFEAEGSAGADPKAAGGEAPPSEFTPEAIPLQLEDVEKPSEEKEREKRRMLAAMPPTIDGAVGLPTREQPGPPPETVDTPFYKTWWFWTLTGVIIGGTVAVGLAVSQPTETRIRSCGRQYVGCFGDGR